MTDLLTEAEAQTLAEARAILRDLQDRAFEAGVESDENAEHDHGYVFAKCDSARDSLTAALIALKVYGDSDNAAAVL